MNDAVQGKSRILVMLLAAFTILVSSLVYPVGARAQAAFYRCQVLMAGPMEDDRTVFWLRGISVEFGDKWFEANPLRAKEQLAVALAAMLNDKNVFVKTDLEAPGKPRIEGLVLIK